MKINHAGKYIRNTALLTLTTIGAVACSSDELPSAMTTATNLLNDTWETGCQVNPQLDFDADSPTGYFRETLAFNDLSAVQTFEYFQDVNCNTPVTAGQVANQDETLFLSKQSQQFALSYPEGSTTTDLGTAHHLDLQVISVSIDNKILSDAELQLQGIQLLSLQGLFIVTESDRLHISTSSTRPTTVPLGQFYTRTAD